MSRQNRRDKSNCPISYSLDLFGDRWTLVVLRDLILWGKTRFAELQASDEQIAKALQYIRRHATANIRVADILGAVSLSRRTLEKRFKHWLEFLERLERRLWLWWWHWLRI